MIAFGSGASAAATAVEAAHEAAEEAAVALQGRPATLAIVFASSSYLDVDRAGRAVRDVVGDAQIVGGTSAGPVFGGGRVADPGVSVILLAGDGLAVQAGTARLSSASFMDAVPAAERIRRAADAAAQSGLGHLACLVFAPDVDIDGEALVAAIRKGAGAHAQLAGGLAGGARDGGCVFFGDELRRDCVVLVGLFTGAPVGIAARHGCAAVGPVRRVTRADGLHLVELDDRPALDAWVEDVQRAGGQVPERDALPLYLATHYELGIADSSAPRIAVGARDVRELVARAPIALRADGALQMSASIGEGSHVRVLHGTPEELLRGARAAAVAALDRVGQPPAGALVLPCTARSTALGEAFADEPAAIREELGALTGGACVSGEIARNVRDIDAFFNTTVVVVAFPSS